MRTVRIGQCHGMTLSMINSHQTVVLWSSEWGRAGEGGEGIIYICIVFSLLSARYARGARQAGGL